MVSILEGVSAYLPTKTFFVDHDVRELILLLLFSPGTILSPPVYNKFGLAGGCILGNVITGIVTIALLYIALAPATTATFAIFVALLYASFPCTVISQVGVTYIIYFTTLFGITVY